MSDQDLSDKAFDAITEDQGTSEPVPGPSPNPATNLMINDIILRSVGRIARMTVEKAILGKQYGKELAKDAVENRSTVKTLTAYAITKVATRSIPGAALVTTGLIVKTLFDRSQRRREAIRRGDKTIRNIAQGDD